MLNLVILNSVWPGLVLTLLHLLPVLHADLGHVPGVLPGLVLHPPEQLTVSLFLVFVEPLTHKILV